jgi:hypothetical protein
MTCFTCGERGHTSRICPRNQRGPYRGNNQVNNNQRYSNRGPYRGNNQVNYMDEECYDDEYDVYNMEYNDYNENDGYDEYNDDGYDVYEIDNDEDIEEYDMYPALRKKSERTKDTVMNDERDRRRNMQWQGQQNKAQGNKRGFTPEQMQKAKETRKRNNLCRKCGQHGHFANECTNERVRLNRKLSNVEEFDPVKGLMNSNVSITWEQYLNEKPNVKKKLRNGLKY